MSFFSDLLGTLFERRNTPLALLGSDSRSITELAGDLLGSHGEVSGAILSQRILDRYMSMDHAGKLEFFNFLTNELGIDTDSVQQALAAYRENESGSTYRTLMANAEPPRLELIRRLNQAQGAMGTLVAIRQDLLKLSKANPHLQILDQDFRHLFKSWFNRGFLVLRPIDWETPAHLLEKIIEYEAVHAIDDWDALRQRLQPADRRCFAFFHPAMPDEPLIFVEVALTRGIPVSIQDLLSEDRDEIHGETADTAVFYSISNCQDGLSGISFGNSLIKQVVADLSARFPNLETFVTLSPIPGLVRWLDDQGIDAASLEGEQQRAWAANYLLRAKSSNGAPLDPVARFHLGNGAKVHQVHAGADASKNGLRQSAGVMVNYLYDRSQIAANHEQFITNREIAASDAVRKLAGEVRGLDKKAS